MTPLDKELRALAEEWGADLYGVGDLTTVREALRAWAGEMIMGFPRSITVGVRLMDAIVDEIPSDQRMALLGYRSHAYDVVNARLDALTSRLASAVQREGHRAMPIAASGTAGAVRRLPRVRGHLSAARLHRTHLSRERAARTALRRPCLLALPRQPQRSGGRGGLRVVPVRLSVRARISGAEKRSTISEERL